MIQWHFVLGVIPVPVIVTDAMADWKGGSARGPIAQVRPRYIASGDKGLVNHELRHVRQWWVPMLICALIAVALYLAGSVMWGLPLFVGLVAHPLMYTMLPRYRLWAEVDAYKEQIKAYGLNGPSDWIITAIQTKYDLQYSREFIKEQF